MAADLARLLEIATAAATDDAAGTIAAIDRAAFGSSVDDVVADIRRLRLGQLVLATVTRDGATCDHPAVAGLLASFPAARSPLPDPTPLLDAFVEIRDQLAKRGVPVLLLKGVVLAELLYGGIGHRPQHDLDILIPKHHARRVATTLDRLGYDRNTRDAHAMAFRRDGVDVDVHRSLRSAPAYGIDTAAAWRTARDGQVAGIRFRTLSDEMTLALLTVSLVEDIAFGMAKVRSLCDVWLLARHLDERVDWDDWLDLRAAERLEAISANGILFALTALDRGRETPNFTAALKRRETAILVRDRAQLLGLLEAPKGSPANMAWMGRIYPGWLTAFRLQPVLAGLPGSLRGIGPSTLRRQVRLFRSRRAVGDRG
jgi:hypothetical protein